MPSQRLNFERVLLKGSKLEDNETIINRESVSRLLGEPKRFLRSEEYELFPLKKESKVDTEVGIRTAHPGDYIMITNQGGSHLKIVTENEVEELYVLVDNG